MKIFLLLILGFVGFGSLQAQFIFTNSITGTNPNTANPYTAGQSVNPNITASGIGRGAGINGVNANDRYNADDWQSGSFDATDYFTFTLTPNAGYDIDFISFVYNGEASISGPTNFALRSSVDGFTTNIGSPISTGATISLTGAQYQNRVTPTEFRLYGWGASDAGGTFSVNDFIFNGAVTACAPTTAPSGFSTPSITTNSIEIALGSIGNGDNVLIVARTGAPVTFVPVNGQVYTVGQALGDQTTVVYKGNSLGVVLDNLFEGVEYHFAVFAFNNAIPCYNTTALTGSATTLCNVTNVTGLSGNCGNTIAAPAWTHATCYDEYLVVAKEGSSITGSPSGDGSNYSANLNYGDGDAFDGGFIVYKGTLNNTGGNVTGLTIGVTYYFKVFTRKDLTWSSGVESNCSPAIPTLATDFFRSNVANGNWANASSWQSSSDGLVWSNASAAPTVDAAEVVIRAGHNITISASRTILNTTVESGGTLTITSGTLTLEDDGTAAHDLIIFGTVLHQGASWVIGTDATWIIQDGGTYIQNTSSAIAASLDEATISAGSNFIYRNTTNVALQGRTYGNLSFENTTMFPTTANAGGGNPITILGNLRIGELYTINNTLSNIWDIEGDFRIDGNFNISSNDGDKVIQLGGNLIISTGASLFENFTGTGTIIFDGEEEQFITALGSIQNEVNFVIDNPEGAGLLSNLSLPSDLTLVQGHLSLYNSNFQIEGDLLGLTSTRYLRTNGTGEYRTLVADTPVLYPIGNSAYNPVLLSHNGDTTLIGARVVDSVSSQGTTGVRYINNVVDRVWVLSGDLNGAELTLVVQWNEDEELGTFDRSVSYISQYLNGLWDPSDPSAASGSDPYTHTRTGITELSVFGVGSAGALPVNLLTFNTRSDKNNQLVYWTYESAERFDYFELEHSRNAGSFSALGKIYEADLTAKSGEAKYMHMNPGAGTHYYRLKMVDLDGSFKHSHVIQGRIEGKGSVRPLSTFISSEGINVNIDSSISSLELRLIDQLGRTIYHSTQSAEAGVFNLKMSNLGSGLYFLQVNADGEKETFKMIR